jgi:hypothetical protein
VRIQELRSEQVDCSSLMAKPDANSPDAYRFDIRLRGGNETVLFDAQEGARPCGRRV